VPASIHPPSDTSNMRDSYYVDISFISHLISKCFKVVIINGSISKRKPLVCLECIVTGPPKVCLSGREVKWRNNLIMFSQRAILVTHLNIVVCV
jgi:hypothetical protein